MQKMRMIPHHQRQKKNSFGKEPHIDNEGTSYLTTHLPSYLPTQLPTYLVTYLPSYLQTNLPSYLVAYLLSYLQTYLPSYLVTYKPSYLSIIKERKIILLGKNLTLRVHPTCFVYFSLRRCNFTLGILSIVQCPGPKVDGEKTPIVEI